MGEQFTDLMKLAAKLNADDYTVFVSFRGQVSWITIEVFRGGWSFNKEDGETFCRTFAKDENFSVVMNDCIDWLTDDHKKFLEAQSA